MTQWLSCKIFFTRRILCKGLGSANACALPKVRGGEREKTIEYMPTSTDRFDEANLSWESNRILSAMGRPIGINLAVCHHQTPTSVYDDASDLDPRIWRKFFDHLHDITIIGSSDDVIPLCEAVNLIHCFALLPHEFHTFLSR